MYGSRSERQKRLGGSAHCRSIDIIRPRQTPRISVFFPWVSRSPCTAYCRLGQQWQHPASSKEAHIIISSFALLFPSTSPGMWASLPICTTGFVLHKVACSSTELAGRMACAELIAEKDPFFFFLTHFASFSIANNDKTRSSSSLSTHVRDSDLAQSSRVRSNFS